MLIIMKMPVNQSQNSQWSSQKIYIIILKICIVVMFDVSQFFADPFLCLTLVQGYHQLISLKWALINILISHLLSLKDYLQIPPTLPYSELFQNFNNYF